MSSDSARTPALADPLGWVHNTLATHHRVDGVAAEGGFAVVYRAHHLAFGAPVAIKALKLRSDMRPTERHKLLVHFLSEARILYRLSQRSNAIVRPLFVGDAVSPSGVWSPFLVLEWLEGQTLAERLAVRAQPMPLEAVIALLAPVAGALAIAHHEGIAHRDVKPGNVFVLQERDGRLASKLLDFGVAKLVRDSADSFAVTQEAIGFTRAYGAPEQFDATIGASGSWTDVHALALVMVELLAGRPAYRATSDKALAEEATDPERRPTSKTLGVDLPAEVERVFARALAFDPRNRYRDAGQLWDALERASTAARPGTAPWSPSRGSAASIRPWRWLVAGILLALLTTAGIALVERVLQKPVSVLP